MYSSALLAALLAQGAFAQVNRLLASAKLGGSRQSLIVDETAVGKGPSHLRTFPVKFIDHLLALAWYNFPVRFTDQFCPQFNKP